MKVSFGVIFGLSSLAMMPFGFELFANEKPEFSCDTVRVGEIHPNLETLFSCHRPLSAHARGAVLCVYRAGSSEHWISRYAEIDARGEVEQRPDWRMRFAADDNVSISSSGRFQAGVIEESNWSTSQGIFKYLLDFEPVANAQPRSEYDYSGYFQYEDYLIVPGEATPRVNEKFIANFNCKKGGARLER